MQRLEVATDVFVEPEPVYDLLLSFEGYERYSEFLDDVTRRGDGGPGTEYDLTASWWRLSHTVRSRVTAVEPPNAIDWTLTSTVDASGSWRIEPVETVAGSVDPPDEDAPVTRVRLVVEYDPASADADAIGLPALLSVGAITDRVRPAARREAERVVERIVADLEGEPRPIDLDVEQTAV